MARQLLVRLPRLDEDACEWAVVDGGELVGETGRGALDAAAEAASGLRVTLVVPADGVLLAETRVPGGGNVQRAQVAAKYALEEQLADDVEELHFALGARRDGDLWPVAVIDRDAMVELGARCAAAGLRPQAVVPETLALPLFDPDEPPGTVWTLLADGDEALVRLGDHAGFVCDADMAGAMLDGARRESLAGGALAGGAGADGDAAGGPPAAGSGLQLVLYETAGAAPVEPPADLEVERRRADGRLELHAAGLAAAPAINLLQGEFSPRTQFDRTWKPWRWTAGLAAALALIVIGGRWLDLRALAAHEAALDAEIASTFEEALPGVRRVRPRQQMQQALERIGGGGGGGGFSDRMAQIAAGLATQPQTTVNSIGVRGTRFDLDLSTDDVPTLDALGTALAERGALTLTVQSANRDDEGVRARVRVE